MDKSLDCYTPNNNYYFELLYKAVGAKINYHTVYSIVDSYSQHNELDLKLLKIIVKNNVDAVVSYIAHDGVYYGDRNDILKVLLSNISPNYDAKTMKDVINNLKFTFEYADEEGKTIINHALRTLSKKQEHMRTAAFVFKQPLIKREYHPQGSLMQNDYEDEIKLEDTRYIRLYPSKLKTKAPSARPVAADKIKIKSRQYRSAPTDSVKMSMSSRSVR